MLFVLALLFVSPALAYPPDQCYVYAGGGAFTPFNISDGTITVTLIQYGATITHLYVPDITGTLRDVVLGFDDGSQYCQNASNPYFGAQIGRVANRIANGTFSLDGTTYHIPRNEKNYDNLHSGPLGFDHHMWDIVELGASTATLFWASPTGDQGFPGSLELSVTFTVRDGTLTMFRQTGFVPMTTIYNPTHHGYFNLHGFMGNTDQTILEHVLEMPNASTYLVVDSHLIPTGEIRNVGLTPPNDFRVAKPIGRDIVGTGYDTAFVTPMATVWSPMSGIKLSVSNNRRDSMQIYTGGYLDGIFPRKQSQTFGDQPQFYEQFSGVVLETQSYPDAINHPEWWTFTDSTIVAAGKVYNETTTFSFSISV